MQEMSQTGDDSIFAHRRRRSNSYRSACIPLYPVVAYLYASFVSLSLSLPLSPSLCLSHFLDIVSSLSFRLTVDYVEDLNN